MDEQSGGLLLRLLVALGVSVAIGFYVYAKYGS
jgi:hypothetical protein